LLEQEIERRNFPDWTMGFGNDAQVIKAQKAFQLSDNTLIDLENKAVGAEVMTLFKSFYNTSMH